MKKIDLSKKFWQWAAFVTMSFIWGASFILIKKGLLAYSPQQSGALRMVFASSFFLPIGLKRLKLLNKKNFKFLLIAGFVGNFFPAFMFAYGETHVSSTIASMLNSTTPIFTLLIGILIFASKSNKYNFIGLILGFIGTMGLVVKDTGSIFIGWNIGALAILIATFFYGINANVVKKFNKGLDGLTVSSLSFILIFPVAVIYFFSTNVSAAYHSPHFWTSTIALATLAFFGSFAANIIYNIFIIKTSAILAASVTYVIPVFSLMWGLLDGEKISLLHIFSILIVFAGITLINKKSTKVQLAEVKNKV